MKKVLYPFAILLTGLAITGSSLVAYAAKDCTILPRQEWSNKCSTVCKSTNRTIDWPKCTEDCINRLGDQCKTETDPQTNTNSNSEVKTETKTRTFKSS